jgi:hypothetical protein
MTWWMDLLDEVAVHSNVTSLLHLKIRVQSSIPTTINVLLQDWGTTLTDSFASDHKNESQ